MKKVVIGFNEAGEPYVIAKPKNMDLQIIVKQPQKKPIKKKLKSLWWRLKEAL